MILFILAMPFAFFLLIDVLGLPSLIKYTIDVAWVCLLGSMLGRKGYRMSAATKRMAIAAGVFFGATIIGFLFHYDSILYYLWGMRNNARFFVFFFACIVFMKREGVEPCFKFLDGLFWLNLPITLVQYFMLGYKQDYLGGIFGVEKGCNAFMNIFFMIIVTKSILDYLNNRESVRKCLIKCAVALLIAAFAELKMFFVEFAVIVIMAIVITKSSYKKLWIGLGAMAGIVVFVNLLQTIFPEFANWFNLKSIWETITSTKGYTASGDMNRLTLFSIALESFLKSPLEKIFGLGLGNCDYANFDFLVTPFYKSYSALSYTWFSSAYLILETGVLGLILYVLFFVMIFFSVRRMKRKSVSETVYCQLAQIMAVMSVVLIIYNSSMRMESAFMMYFVLAVPFIVIGGAENQKLSLGIHK